MSDHDQLIPDDVRASLPTLYSTEAVADPVVRLKLFAPWSSWTWYVTEFDGEDTLFGLVSGHEVELGYICLSELEELRGPGGLRIERDLHFTPKPLSQVRKDVAKLRGDGDIDGVREEPAVDDEADPNPERIRAVSPMENPAITMVETRLASAWAETMHGTVANPNHAAAIMQKLVGESDREHFVALYLNARHQVTHTHIVARGTAVDAPVHPREVFKGAVLANAVAVVVGHNHPSGDVAPSNSDELLFERLKAAGELLGIEVLDALVVGRHPRFHSASLGRIAVIDSRYVARQSHTENATSLAKLAKDARFLVSGQAGDMFEETAENLAHQVIALSRQQSPEATVRGVGQHDLEKACQGLLQDISEVLERQGEGWWDATVTSGTHHRAQAERLLGHAAYGPNLKNGAEPS